VIGLSAAAAAQNANDYPDKWRADVGLRAASLLGPISIEATAGND
jgi:hypothetical protein